MRISKTTKQTIHHVLSCFITSHLNQVIRRRSQIGQKREVLSMGFRKGMAAFGGGILFTFLFCHFLVYADIKDRETNNSSCLIIFHHVSSKSSNQEEIPNLTETGGSKYGVPGMAAFGRVWLHLEEVSFLHFCFVISWFMRISKTTKQTIHHV